MANIRSVRSDDKYKQDLDNDRVRKSTSRKNQSEQKRQAEKDKDAVRKSTFRKNQSEQKRHAEKAKNAVRNSTSRRNQSEQKRDAEKAKNAKTRRDKRQKESPEEANSRRSKRTTPSRPAVDSAEEGGILSENSIKKSKETALKYLHRTLDPETGMHQSNVCVVCDCFILGTQKVKRLNKK